MTIQDLGSIGELVAAAATVVTLVYLAAQIRSNTKSVEANSYHAISSMALEVNRSVIDNPEVARILVAGQQDPSSLTAEELARFGLLMANRFRQFDNIYYHYRRGLLDESRWRAQRRIIAELIHPPGVRTWWRESSRSFSKEFVQEVEDLLDRVSRPGDEQ